MKAWLKSMACAFRGLQEAFSERNFVVEIFCGVVVVVFIVVFRMSYIESSILLLCVGLVLGAEVMNSALERLSDFVSPSHHKEIGIIKDLMAAGVLIFALSSLVIAIIIFGHLLLPMQ